MYASKAPSKMTVSRPGSVAALPRTLSTICLAGEGSLDVYNNKEWTLRRGTSPMDAELRDNWETSAWEVLDLALVMDCTGSMAAWIDNCKTTLTAVIDTIVNQNPKLKVRVAFVGYRDFTDDKMFAIHDFTFDIEGVKGFISSQVATGGQDEPEDVAGALYRAAQLSWFPGSVRLASLVADAPTHGTKYHNLRDNFPQGSPAGIHIEQIVKQLLEMRVDLTLYKLGNTTEKMYDIMEEAGRDRCREAGISFVDLRREVKESRSRGLELNSRFMSNAYSNKSSEHMSSRFALSSTSSVSR